MSLLTQPIKTDSYQLDAALSTDRLNVTIQGTFDMAAAPNLALFLVSIEGDVKRRELSEVLVNVVEVYYLGSSCIKSFVNLVQSLKKSCVHTQLRILTNPRLDWHDRTFSVLARLSPTQVTVERAL